MQYIYKVKLVIQRSYFQLYRIKTRIHCFCFQHVFISITKFNLQGIELFQAFFKFIVGYQKWN